jgi:hypothetical protein
VRTRAIGNDSVGRLEVEVGAIGLGLMTVELSALDRS